MHTDEHKRVYWPEGNEANVDERKKRNEEEMLVEPTPEVVI